MGILCILIPIIVGLICALLGYLLGRLIEKKSKVYTKLRADLDACRQENQRLQSENSSLENKIASLSDKSGSMPLDSDAASAKFDTASTTFDSALAKSVFGKKIVENDLKIVEGIGPKIEELFKNAGIKTWEALSETSVDKCQQILDDAGPRYRVHTPSSWPKQSKMAYLGKWNELKKWQDEAIGGKG